MVKKLFHVVGGLGESWRPRHTGSTDGVRVAAELSLAARGLHLLTLVSLALAQPLFDLIYRDPMILVTHRLRPWEIVGLTTALVAALPAALVAVEALASGIHRRLGQWLHAALVGVLLLSVALPAWKRLILLPGTLLIGLAVATAALGAWAYRRFIPVRSIVTFASPCILLFPGLFLLRDPIWPLIALPPKVEVPDPPVGNPAPVVMVILDEFSGTTLMNEHHRIDAVRYPHFAALAETATWYRNATTVSEGTRDAIPALLTGRWPDEARPPTLAHNPHNLFTLLDSHYQITAFEPFTSLCPNSVDPEVIQHTPERRLGRFVVDLAGIYLRFVLPSDLTDPLPPRRLSEFHKWTWGRQRSKQGGLVRYDWMERRDEQFEHFLECLRPAARRETREDSGGTLPGTGEDSENPQSTPADFSRTPPRAEAGSSRMPPGEKPPLYFCHVVLPHIHYEYLPSGKKHRGVQGVTNARWNADPLETLQFQQHYLLQVGFADQMIGRLVGRLKAVGLYDDCLLVLVADHGVAFRPGESPREANRVTYPEVLPVPLFVKAPGQTQGFISDRNVESIDVLPTMADLLDVQVPWRMDGQTAADPALAERPKKVIFAASGRLEFDAEFLEKDSAVLAQLTWFGSGTLEDKLFRIGPNHELVGKPLAGLRVVDRPGEAESSEPASDTTRAAVDRPIPKITLLHREDFQKDYDPKGLFAPCLVEGRVELEAPPPRPLELAVAVNGTVQAVTRTFTTEGQQTAWRAMIPEAALRPGPNELRVFVVQKSGAETTLHAAEVD
jgi:hypothetical protein